MKDLRKSFELYLYDDIDCAWLQQFDCGSKTRIVENLSFFNDVKENLKPNKIPVIFVKIIDKSGLIPPLPQHRWDARKINEILAGEQIQRISDGAFRELATTSYSHGSLFVVFCLDNDYFARSITFKNPGTEKLIRKIKQSIVNVELFNIKRCDFKFLSMQIGNDGLLNDRTILIIGAGSLGSMWPKKW